MKARHANPDKVRVLKKAIARMKKAGAAVGTILRAQAVLAYYKGMGYEIVATCFDVSERSVMNWVARYEDEGEDGLEDRPRSGRPVELPADQAQALKDMIAQDNQRVWTARHVYVVLSTMFQVCYSVKYLPEFLKRLGLSFHKAVHELVRKNAEKRKQWIQEQLPALYAEKLKAGWRIFFQDEAGFQTEGTLAYSWGIKGEPIQIKNYGRHGRMNMIGAFELGSGVFYGVLTSFKVNACRFRRFLCHLKHEMRTDKIMLICDNASFHKAKWLQTWVADQAAWLRMEFLPAYSPDFNPIERLWHWIRTEFTHNKCWPNLAALAHDLRSMLTQLPARACQMQTVMQAEIERLQTIYEFYDTPCPFATIK